LAAAVAAVFVATSDGAASVAVATASMSLPAWGALVMLCTRRGVERAFVAATSSAVLAGLAFFVAFTATTYAPSTPAATSATLHEYASSGMHSYRAWAIGDSLGGACFMLVFVPIVGLALAGIACEFAARRATRA